MKKLLLATCTLIIFSSSIAIACNDQIDEIIINKLYESKVKSKKMSKLDFYSKYCKDQAKIEVCNNIAKNIVPDVTKDKTSKFGSK
jgi:hypothetical protein